MGKTIDISQLSIEELVALNKQISEPYNYLVQMEAYKTLAKFKVADRVYFTTQEGEKIKGTITGLNKKTATMIADNQKGWRVLPTLLKRISSEKVEKNNNNVLRLQPL
jgi:hypothetical protein